MSGKNKQLNIHGVDKECLLKALWKEAPFAPYFNGRTNRPSFGDEEMPKGYVEYYCGKAIKMDLSKDVIDATLYDRQNGEGVCERVVASLVEKRVEKAKQNHCRLTRNACVFESLNVPMMQNTCRKCGLERLQHGGNATKRAKVASHVSKSTNESNESTDDESKEDSEPDVKKNANKRCIFKPFGNGEPMLRDDPGTVMCAICGHFKKNHL